MVEMPMIAKGADELYLLPGMTNRHGLVAGATGTGKTVTLQVMAEALSSIGVPVFAADVKGDLSGISQPGKSSPKFDARVAALGLGRTLSPDAPPAQISRAVMDMLGDGALRAASRSFAAANSAPPISNIVSGP